MIKSDKPCLIDSVEIGEVNVYFIGPKESVIPGATLHAKYALTISGSGTRLGAGTRNFWSDETNTKLRELIASMEKDICVDVFGGTPEESTIDPSIDEIPGL